MRIAPSRSTHRLNAVLWFGLTILAGSRPTFGSTTVNVFNHVGVQFGGDAAWNFQANVNRLDNGRIVERTLTLPAIGQFSQVTAQLNVWGASDPWDRAGSIQLVTGAGVVELHKFVTGFGGTTQHQQDVTNLAPYLRQGPVTIRAFVDTWVQQAWAIDFKLTVTDDAATRTPRWNRAMFNDQDWRAGDYPSNRRTETVTIPSTLEKVYLSYLPSGHAIDGSGGDEFTPRTHKIFIDGVEVFNEIPWRTDGINFRSVNPYSGRFGNVWSSDLNRAGWIPGDDVDPYVIDVSQYLTAGSHTIEYEIDGIRPQDASGYGYWRVSSYLTGIQNTVSPADVNLDRKVDGSDFLVWQRGFGRTGDANNSHGDISGNGSVGSEDLALWSSAFGAPFSSATVTTVPEPHAAAMIVWALMMAPLLSRTRSCRCIPSRRSRYCDSRVRRIRRVLVQWYDASPQYISRPTTCGTKSFAEQNGLQAAVKIHFRLTIVMNCRKAGCFDYTRACTAIKNTLLSAYTLGGRFCAQMRLAENPMRSSRKVAIRHF